MATAASPVSKSPAILVRTFEFPFTAATRSACRDTPRRSVATTGGAVQSYLAPTEYAADLFSCASPASQAAGECIRHEGMRQGIGLPRRRLVIDRDAGHLRVLIRIGMQDAAEQQHLPFCAGGIHFGFEFVPVGLRDHRIGGAVDDQQRRLDITWAGRRLGLEIAVD